MSTSKITSTPILLERQVEGGVERQAAPEIILSGTGKRTAWERLTRDCSAASIGTWHGEEGMLEVRSYPSDEIFFVTSGRIRLHLNDGTLDVRAGQAAFVPKGWRGRWENVEPSDKVFVILSD